jgi:acetyl-CoA carboxylase carboxyltransferase component
MNCYSYSKIKTLNTYSSKIQFDKEELNNNYSFHQSLSTHLKEKIRDWQHRPDNPIVLRHKQRNKLLARERLDLLLDKSTPFLELSPLAAIDQYDNEFPAAGIITGIGLIDNRAVVVIANDATVKGGTYIPETIKKHLRAQEIAMKCQIPLVYLVDSGGIFLPEQARVFADKENFGRIFFNQARMSALGLPQIAVVMGSCTAGGAYIPAMSDETIMVRNQGTIFLGGPPLVKAATGEDVTAEELGGAEVHTHYSGVADYIAENDEHAIAICRQTIQALPTKYQISSSTYKPIEPKNSSNKLYGLIPSNPKQNINHYEVIARLVDNSEFHEFKQDYGTTLITGYARIMGYQVGIVANNGILFSESALKGTQFIEICCHRKIPLIFLQDIAGFIVGKEYEHKGIAKDGAKMVMAVANANVPKITIITGKSFGAGNYAMSGRAFDPDFLFMWPNARIAVMGGEQAALVLNTVKSKSNENNNSINQEILEKFEYESSPYYSTSRIWDDGIIDPLDTRNIIGLCLSVVTKRDIGDPKSGIYRM